MDKESVPAAITAAIAFTGIIRALELHADAVSEHAGLLRDGADDLRSTRDALLEAVGVTREQAEDEDGYGQSRDWTRTMGWLAHDDVQWGYDPSRDPWSARG